MKLARAIYVDKTKLRELSKRLQEVVADKTKGKHGPLGNVMLVSAEPFVIRTVYGTDETVFVRLQSKKLSSPYYADSGGLGTLKGHTFVVVFLNGSLDAEVLYESASSNTYLIADHIYKVLLHEVTHAADNLTKNVGKRPSEEETRNDPRAYYNDPVEVRAYLQEILDEVSPKAKLLPKFQKIFGISKGVVTLLNQCKTWQDIEPYLNETNKRLILKAVALELEPAKKVAARFRLGNKTKTR